MVGQPQYRTNSFKYRKKSSLYKYMGRRNLYSMYVRMQLLPYKDTKVYNMSSNILINLFIGFMDHKI